VRLLVAQDCVDAGLRKSLVLRVCQISRSSFYYKPRYIRRKVGRACTSVTYKRTGECEPDSTVVEDIKMLLSLEFVDYGYYKVTIYLRDEKSYQINPKKVYRLMKENNLLYVNRGNASRSKRQWVKDLVPDPMAEFTYLEIDIKYVYVQGKRRNAQVLTVLDVFSRWNLAGRPVAPFGQVEYTAAGCGNPFRNDFRKLFAAFVLLCPQ
jgi:putative transposase